MSKLEYKVGDRVKIKSLDWYNENKDEYGRISCGYVPFISKMSIYCGKVLTICGIKEKFSYYYMKECEYAFTNEMIEGLVEEETKPKFKVGDKITNGKDKLLILNIVSDKYIVEDNLGECGTVYFNIQDDWKLVEEEIDACKKCGLVRNSTRCLSMDNCPHNKQRKFNVGDIVYSKTWQRNVIIHEILPGCFYKVGDLFSTNWFKEYEDNLCKEVVRSTTEYTLPDGYQFKDENGNVINATKIVLEKKKKEYPKTYEECAEIIAELTGSDCNPKGCMGYMSVQLTALQKLYICRDAYWKIAGEEMGLGKPWEPDYNEESYEQGCPIKYVIYYTGTHITKGQKCTPSYILSFPTEEMRDAFKENFDPDIEICKEFL